MSGRTWPLLAALLPASALLASAWARPPVPAPRKNEPKPVVNSIGMKFVPVPAGKFQMGPSAGEKESYASERPRHEVEITRPFHLGAFEVTQKQFKELMGYNPSHFSFDGAGRKDAEYLATRRPAGGKGKLRGVATTDDFPAENFSHDEAVEFCKKLTALPAEKKARRAYRLPTEAEWEYACRGASSAPEPFHFARPSRSLSSRQANFDGNYSYGGARSDYLGRTCKVGSFKPNALGLYDLHGNVWEWCSDWYGKDYYAISPRKDPTGPANGYSRVIRGGGWDSDAGMCRAAGRLSYEPRGRVTEVGLRVVLVPVEK